MTPTLPYQNEVDAFLKDFFVEHQTETFHITELTAKVIDAFGIDIADAKSQCEFAHGLTNPSSTTYIEQLCHWGCSHLLDRYVKRTAPNQYQYFHGPTPAYQRKSLDRKLVDQAVVSVKLLKEMNHEPVQIICELSGKWDDHIIEAALKKYFVVDNQPESSTMIPL